MFADESGGDKKPTAAAVEDAAKSAVEVADLEIEIKRGPAPDMSKRGGGGSIASGVQDATSLAKMKADEAAAIASGWAFVLIPFPLPEADCCWFFSKPAGVAKAQSVIANFNAMLKAKAAGRSGESDLSTDSARRRDPDATDFHVRPLSLRRATRCLYSSLRRPSFTSMTILRRRAGKSRTRRRWFRCASVEPLARFR